MKRTKSAVTLIGCLATLTAAPSLAADLNVLRELRLEPTATGARLLVTGSRPPVFTVFRLSGPDRLVIDMAASDASAVRGARDGQGPILGINVSQFTDSTASVGRLLVTLREAKSYDVKADGDQLVVSVLGEGKAPGTVASVPTTPVPQPRSSAVAPPAAPAAVTASVEPSPASSSGAAAGDVVSVARESRAVRTPAHHLTAVRVQGETLQLSFDGDVRGYELLRLGDPSRLVLDVTGVKLATTVRKAPSGPFTTLRAGAHPDKVRLVVDVDGALEGRVSFSPHGLRWTVSPARSPLRSPPPPPPGVASRTARWRSMAAWSPPRWLLQRRRRYSRSPTCSTSASSSRRAAAGSRSS